jgi:hypothetical protein
MFQVLSKCHQTGLKEPVQQMLSCFGLLALPLEEEAHRR